jgi:hypothetical protein
MAGRKQERISMELIQVVTTLATEPRTRSRPRLITIKKENKRWRTVNFKAPSFSTATFHILLRAY